MRQLHDHSSSARSVVSPAPHRGPFRCDTMNSTMICNTIAAQLPARCLRASPCQRTQVMLTYFAASMVNDKTRQNLNLTMHVCRRSARHGSAATAPAAFCGRRLSCRTAPRSDRDPPEVTFRGLCLLDRRHCRGASMHTCIMLACPIMLALRLHIHTEAVTCHAIQPWGCERRGSQSQSPHLALSSRWRAHSGLAMCSAHWERPSGMGYHIYFLLF